MALAFSRITEQTAQRIRALRQDEGSELSEYSLAYTFHWGGEAYWAEFGETDGCGVLRFTIRGRRYYSLPFGPGDRARALAAVRRQEPERLMLGLLTEDEAARYQAAGWIVRDCPWGVDYVYRQSDLAELKGTRYQAKRNFCHRFEKAGDWHYGPFEPSAAREILSAWRAAKGAALDEEAEIEIRALDEDVKTATLGGVLYQGGRAVAFALGERLTDDMILEAYEKALPDVPGAFQMINREFARREGAGYVWINRAGADGHPALEKAKESYCPARRLRKFMAIDPFLPGTGTGVPRLAQVTAEDLDDVVRLWQRTFGDDESFVRPLAGVSPGFVIRDAQGLAAMGFALAREGSRYVYALATRPDCRKLGYASAVLETIWLAFPMEPLSLVPGTPDLEPFYERRGFAVASRGDYTTMMRPPRPGYRVPDPMN